MDVKALVCYEKMLVIVIVDTLLARWVSSYRVHNTCMAPYLIYVDLGVVHNECESEFHLAVVAAKDRLVYLQKDLAR